jgi:hypothetical protein
MYLNRYQLYNNFFLKNLTSIIKNDTMSKISLQKIWLQKQLKKNKIMKTLKIEIPNGFEIDKENSTFEQIVFKELEKALPKSWKDLKEIDGFYITFNSNIVDVEENPTIDYNKNVFATKEQAKASIALAQLSQLRDVYRNGWVPDWNKVYEEKHCIHFQNNEIIKEWFYQTNIFLSFQDAETRDLFLENFKDLIEQAKPLMS